MARIVVAMSGGVDSSVAAALLQRAGHEVIGLFMRHQHQATTSCAAKTEATSGGMATLPIVSRPVAAPPARKQGCCSAGDAEDARRVADRLEIPFYALDFTEEFGAIQDYFVDEYLAGRTPNPCVVCNNWLKFGRLGDYAASVGAESIATGHYARLTRDERGRPALYRGLDPGKDQSYVLFGLSPAVLERALFPVGEYRKSEIRALAQELGLRVAEKPDSQEICFIPDGDYAAFVRERRPGEDRGGEIVTTAGERLGHHQGIEHFTIGQRRGLGVAVGERRYVVRLEPDTRKVVIGTREDLERTRVLAERANWLVDPTDEPRPCEVKIRYNGAAVPGTVRAQGADGLAVTLAEGRQGVAPGQAVVCYEGDRVLCGGWIVAAE